jgi:alpha-amylase/alpha-mannosidase (GH57 family)
LTASRHLIIHGHFYQPPRENPWSGNVPNQTTAAPFANWNLRIARECYSPNTMARILDRNGLIDKIANNFKHLSFNVGPTLLDWLKVWDPECHRLMVEADREAAAERGGHGPAIAQVFNHVIMPLANQRDKKTQVVWGKKHFQRTFGRDPVGMWLAETAVDTESLRLLSEHGMKFTILGQNQIAAVRPLIPSRNTPWVPTPGSSADPREPYRVFWGKGENDHIDVFVYDGQVSKAVAFENLLRDGKAFLDRIKIAFGTPYADRPVLVNLATDGESYGHHFHFGDMALAWLFEALRESPPGSPDRVVLTNHSEFLSLHPPRKEAKIHENSSWSCSHGVERWRADCGCRTGGDPSWNQKWRAPLRDGLDWLRDQIIGVFEREAGELFRDPWEARDDYLEVFENDYETARKNDFLLKHGKPGILEPNKSRKAMEFMEAQLMSLYMFTSCAWFFDDIAGLEPIQNLRYAARAIELTQNFTPVDLAGGLLGFLEKAVPNNPNFATGRDVWNSEVAGSFLNATVAAAQWAAATAMDEPGALKECGYVSFCDMGSEKTRRNHDDPLPHLFAGKVSVEEKRLGVTLERYALALADDGPKLDILIFEPEFERAPDFERAKNLFLEKGPAYLRNTFEALFPGASRHTLETLWTTVRQNILSGQLKEFFDELKEHTVKAFRNYRDALLQYSLKENAWDWMDRFVFRVMAEADLENMTKPMLDGRPIDLAKLKDLISRDAGKNFRNIPVIKESAGIYVKKLFGQLRNGPGRPTLLEELLNFLDFVKHNLRDLDFWEFQNLYYSLIRDDAGFFRSLGPGDRTLLAKIGETLGFSPSITGMTPLA